MAGIIVVFGLSRFCLEPASFYKLLVRSSFIAAGLGQ
jgi:hypothetical protein